MNGHQKSVKFVTGSPPRQLMQLSLRPSGVSHSDPSLETEDMAARVRLDREPRKRMQGIEVGRSSHSTKLFLDFGRNWERRQR